MTTEAKEATTEDQAIAKLDEGEFRWLELWYLQVGGLDQKAGILVTLDGILIALTASFLGSALSGAVTILPRALFAISTILVLISAAACTRVIWVRFYASQLIADLGGMAKTTPKLVDSRTRKMKNLHYGIAALLAALTGFAAAILILIVQA